MRIAVVGTGYVGLVSGACFSEFGVEVVCVDQDKAKIARLQRGEMPIFEPGLEALVAKNAAAGRISFTTELTAAVTLGVNATREVLYWTAPGVDVLPLGFCAGAVFCDDSVLACTGLTGHANAVARICCARVSLCDCAAGETVEAF